MYQNLYIKLNSIIHQSLKNIQEKEKGSIVLLCFPTFHKNFGISFYKYYSSYGWVKNIITEVKEEELTKDGIKLSFLIRKETGLLSEATFREIESKITNTPFPKSQTFGAEGRDGTTYELNLKSAVQITLNWWDMNLGKNSDWQPINQTISEIVEKIKEFKAEESKEFIYIYEEKIYQDNLTSGSRIMKYIEVQPK